MSTENNNYSALYKQFAEWLKKRYDNNGAKEILMALIEVEKFLLSSKKIKNSIFELSSDKAGYVLTNARNNRGFRLAAKVPMKTHQHAAIEIKHFIFEIEKENTYKKNSNVIVAPADESLKNEPKIHNINGSNSESSSDVIDLIKKNKIKYIDNRASNGALWIIGGSELQGFVELCKKNNYIFKYKPEGGKSSNGKPAWWMTSHSNRCTIKEEDISSEDTSNITFDTLLSAPQYGLLREALIKQGIKTIENLKEINLWKFMNSNSLYSIQQRFYIHSTISKKLLTNDTSSEDSSNECTIKYGDITYCGETPSKAFLQFIGDIAKKYPLRFRNLIGVFNPEAQIIVISAYNHDGNKLKLMNPEVYIDSDFTIDQLKFFIPWIEKKCFIPAQNFSVSANAASSSVPAGLIEKMPLEPTKVATTAGQSAEGDEKAEGELGTYTSVLNKDNPESSHPEEKPISVLSQDLSQSALSEDVKQAHGKFPIPAPYQTQIAERNILKADLAGVSFSQLQAFLSTTMVATKEAVSLSPKIIQLDSKLYHEDAFVDFEEGADQIEGILDKLLQKNNGIATMSQLTAYVRSEMDMFLNDNDITEQQAIFDFARHLFEKIDYHGKHYVFKSNMYISLPEISADSNNGIIQRYAREKGTAVSFDEIKDYLDSLGLNTGNLRGVMRINSEPIFFVYQENEYLLAELIHMDDYFFDRIKSALQNLFSDVGDHIIIRAIQNSWYSLLPSLPAGLEWTPLLLQQIVDFYSQILGARTIAALDSQSSNALHSMIVAQDSWIQDFHDVVAVFLHEEYRDRTKFEADELRHILVDNGMISGNQLYLNMHKALGRDSRFIWDTDNANVTVRL